MVNGALSVTLLLLAMGGLSDDGRVISDLRTVETDDPGPFLATQSENHENSATSQETDGGVLMISRTIARDRAFLLVKVPHVVGLLTAGPGVLPRFCSLALPLPTLHSLATCLRI